MESKKQMLIERILNEKLQGGVTGSCTTTGAINGTDTMTSINYSTHCEVACKCKTDPPATIAVCQSQCFTPPPSPPQESQCIANG
jgi:hypothetical protein